MDGWQPQQDARFCSGGGSTTRWENFPGTLRLPGKPGSLNLRHNEAVHLPKRDMCSILSSQASRSLSLFVSVKVIPTSMRRRIPFQNRLLQTLAGDI
jgi:hypothetical protein